MDGPGYSLFNGGDNIQPNTSAIDEEAELERQKSVSFFLFWLSDFIEQFGT